MLTRKQKNIVTIGYFLLLISFLGFYSIYMETTDTRAPYLHWVLLMVLGGGIIGWKNLQFQGEKQLHLITLDVLFIANFYLFSFWDAPYGLNYLLSGIIGSLLIVYILHKKIPQ